MRMLPSKGNGTSYYIIEANEMQPGKFFCDNTVYMHWAREQGWLTGDPSYPTVATQLLQQLTPTSDGYYIANLYTHEAGPLAPLQYLQWHVEDKKWESQSTMSRSRDVYFTFKQTYPRP